MGIIPGIAGKHKFSGIGKTGATGVFLWLSSSNPGLTSGFFGKLLYWVLTKFFSSAASAGLVMMNVGVENVLVMDQKNDYDGSFDEAFKIINEKGLNNLTQEEKDAIDEKVKEAFRKFVDMSRNK